MVLALVYEKVISEKEVTKLKYIYKIMQEAHDKVREYPASKDNKYFTIE